MTVAQRYWIGTQAYQKLQDELATLRHLLATEALDDSSEDLVTVQRARQARIQHIHDMLLNATVGDEPPDDGVAEPGMVLTVRFDETGDTETFLLGLRGVAYGDLEVYSLSSPLGAALLGARVGTSCTYTVPSGATIPVTLLKAVPYGVHDHAG
ncbi:MULTISPECIES: GreA/GreB family elongation factor [Mycobacteriaceae]|uniref:GreA/GreB family elongation factor n=1 Tax=Mycobacteriaceae TaxID=1762 RepID=UPI0007FC6685|nr:MULTISPECIES: GreA/GreB family elongation factor [Mycobacteriaceae]MCK0175273.1 GreA/GreB family elongation factor [Mycolicibacterium sp. F2034L]OBB59797.1 transcription elongation factor GreAB [Mycobacterium sp. 852013-51886_SCH5428379]